MNYFSAHNKIKRHRGPASQYLCPCGSPARHWAYQGSTQEKVSDEGWAYSEDPADYLPMCIDCHVRLDRAHRCPDGTEPTEFMITAQGKRLCLNCTRRRRAAAARQRRKDPEQHARELEYRREWWANRKRGAAS